MGFNNYYIKYSVWWDELIDLRLDQLCNYIDNLPSQSLKWLIGTPIIVVILIGFIIFGLTNVPFLIWLSNGGADQIKAYRQDLEYLRYEAVRVTEKERKNSGSNWLVDGF